MWADRIPVALAWLARRAFPLLALALAAIQTGQATSPHAQLPLSTYDQNTGLASLSVVRLLEDRQRSLWAGTEQGLYRFDGVGFSPATANQGFHTSEVISLAEDEAGHLWVGTRSGLQRRDPNGQFSWVRPSGQTVLADRGQTLASDGQGGMLVVSGHHLLRLIPQADGEWMAAPLLSESRLPQMGAAHFAAVYRHGEDIWFGCGALICRLHRDTLTEFGPAQGVPADKWVGFVSAADGSLWVRGMRTVRMLPAGRDRFVARDIPNGHGDVAATNIDIIEDAAGRILTRTDEGVARWTGREWELFNRSNGLPGVGVSALVTDHDGMVWAGTYGRGVLYWSTNDAVENWTVAQGLSDSLIWSMARGDAKSIWLASEGGGEVLVPGDARAHRWPLDVPPPVQAHAVIADAAGNIWYFLFDGRVVRYEPATGRTLCVGTLPYLIRGAHLDRAGHFWIYTLGGLYELDPTSGEVIRAAPSLIPATMCSDVAEDRLGRLWVTCSSGLFRRNASGWVQVRVTPEDVTGGYENVAATPDGRLWLSSLQPGLLVGQVTDADTVAMSPVNDPLLAATRFYFLRPDHEGRLWAGGGNGVDVLADGRWTRLSTRDGLLWNETNHGAFLADTDGSVWIGAPVGITHVLKPAQLLAPRTMSPLILSARYGDRDVLASSGIQHERSEALDIEVGVLGNSAGHPVRFRYRLQPLDNDWVETTQREIRYAALLSGHYRFQLQAIDENRRTTSDMVTLEFSVARPWWLTWWAFLAGALGLLALAALIWRWRMHVLIVHAHRLEGVVTERTAELQRVLHARRMLLAHISHDLRSPLSAIVDAVRQWRGGKTGVNYPQLIECQAQRQMELIDELLEFSRGELTEMQLEPAPGYLYSFLEELAGNAAQLAMRERNHFSSHWAATLPPVVHADFHRLRQVLSNLLGNAAKYTRDGRIAFHVDVVSGAPEAHVTLRFEVDDTGIGLNQDEAERLIEPFERGANARDREGTGLGLAIATRLLGHMNSRLHVQAGHTGKGSCFWFELVLPLADERDIEPGFASGGMATDMDGAGRIVLVAEPEPALRAVLCDLLDGYGFQTSPVTSADALPGCLREQTPDLIVIDPRWPDADPWELMAGLRRECGDAAVLLYCALPPVRAGGRDSIDAALLKPADADTFMACVMDLVGKIPVDGRAQDQIA
ncbi:signal transduction histidine kinase/ligand-binding sensor domain-containing protein/CheY-like chemotaxis protein [Luteibacter sp. Sphag1AF]|uniref:hybrid sensor histidine kinase/response regulator n=1 Tax=Luteibacter sp. Sphag1AF TaxID=2587031 RepID=UPI001610D2B4|nr:ATP-binding protein [Luteibacter sp. Sphag1AF]MBB3228518.1 signal transduction histidine kinase/ligand-binding sensor domain-containing protein/CheY-like chemotaxis protein [Luteibacter sp. Sphag1AF]